MLVWGKKARNFSQYDQHLLDALVCLTLPLFSLSAPRFANLSTFLIQQNFSN